VRSSVERHLAARGLERATSGTPDLLIHYHANISRRIDVNLADREFGSCAGEDCLGGDLEYEAGTLVIDLVDARTNKVIWRGWAQDSVEGVLDNQDRMARKIEEAVKRMMATLPPTLGRRT
jgi:hypothetical protein